MTGPEDHHLRRGQDRFNENLELAATDKAALSHGFVGEIEAHHTRFFVAEHVLSSRPHFSFDTSAADGPER